MNITSYHIVCKGTVQGVGFRYFTKIEADKYGLKGSVKNLRDGSVEILVKGEGRNVLKFLEWCHLGPKTGQVKSLAYEIIEPKEIQFEDFIIDRK